MIHSDCLIEIYPFGPFQRKLRKHWQAFGAKYSEFSKVAPLQFQAKVNFQGNRAWHQAWHAVCKVGTCDCFVEAHHAENQPLEARSWYQLSTNHHKRHSLTVLMLTCPCRIIWNIRAAIASFPLWGPPLRHLPAMSQMKNLVATQVEQWASCPRVSGGNESKYLRHEQMQHAPINIVV